MGDRALVETHFAGAGRFDIDPPALFLARLDEILLRKMATAFRRQNLRPPGLEIAVPASGDGLILGRPEHLRAGEIAVLVEKIAHDLAAELCQIEQGHLGADRRAAEQPALEPLASGRVIVLPKPQPFALLGLGCQGENLQIAPIIFSADLHAEPSSNLFPRAEGARVP